MDVLASEASSFLLFFRKLPVLTQWAVTILVTAGVIVHFFAYNARTVHDAPSIFTTGGIFFTFLGIAEGLVGFDASNIEASVPSLLSGLQTAFVASVVGVGVALTIKMRYTLFGLRKKQPTAIAQGATVNDLYNQMVAVQQSLVGDDDSTLVSQIKLTRQDTNDRLDRLQKSQTDFMTKMADNNSRALIEALREVIRDFNNKITEQFGDNFRHLNVAVGQLLVWQESYRIQLTEMIEQNSAAAQNMQVAAEGFADVMKKADTFGTVSAQLSDLLTKLNDQRSQIAASIEALGHLLKTASGSLPEIESKIVELTTQMTQGVRQNQLEIGKSLKDSSVMLQETIGDIKKLLLDATQTTNQEVNAHFKQLGERTSEQLAKLDVALEKELTRALTTLASQLTSLSAQFVSDYGPLTANLREIVQSARR